MSSIRSNAPSDGSSLAAVSAAAMSAAAVSAAPSGVCGLSRAISAPNLAMSVSNSGSSDSPGSEKKGGALPGGPGGLPWPATALPDVWPPARAGAVVDAGARRRTCCRGLRALRLRQRLDARNHGASRANATAVGNQLTHAGQLVEARLHGFKQGLVRGYRAVVDLHDQGFQLMAQVAHRHDARHAGAALQGMQRALQSRDGTRRCRAPNASHSGRARTPR